MEQGRIQQLEAYGVDVEQTLRRFVQNESMYEAMLKRFAETPVSEQLREAMAAQRYEDAYIYAHTLKGIAGNLGLTPLFEAASALVISLRKAEYDTELHERLEAVLAEYAQACLLVPPGADGAQ